MPNCNFCKTELTHVFCDLGFNPPSNSFLSKNQLEEPEVYYPLKAYVCEKCWLVQVPESKKASEIFKEEYVYYSSESPANVAHAKELADALCGRFNPYAVLEIGSNDGYMLQWFQRRGCFVQGVEPALGPATAAELNQIATHSVFFNSKYAETSRQYDLIVSINTLAHQPDINDFVEGIKIALKPGGVTVHEFPWLLKTIEGLQFDQIYQEHYNYFSLKTICKIFEAHGLAVFDVDEIPEHGGSLRIYAQHIGGPHMEPLYVHDWLGSFCYVLEEAEKLSGMNALPYYQSFQPKIEKIRADFMNFLYDPPPPYCFLPAKICAYGAAAKASTFLNFCKVTPDLIHFVVDRSPHKIGKYLPGSHIKAVPEDEIRKWKPDYIVILAWNLREEIIKQLEYTKEWGCRFVTAIPELEVI